jgi:hypothetical protein
LTQEIQKSTKTQHAIFFNYFPGGIFAILRICASFSNKKYYLTAEVEYSVRFIPESIVILVVGGLELDIHQVDGGIGCSQEHYLHHGVV